MLTVPYREHATLRKRQFGRIEHRIGPAIHLNSLDGRPMPAFTHHLFVCGNVRDAGHPRGSCDPEGRQTLRDAFKVALKKAGVAQTTRANHAGCLDQCEHGPVVAIYPQGIWYGKVTPEDAPRIVEATIIRGEILGPTSRSSTTASTTPTARTGAGRSEMKSSEIPTSPTIAGTREIVDQARRDGRTIGLVPTMGALHAGHRQLIERAKAASDFVVVSIFVNPTQFGPLEDFRRYPRTIEGDREVCSAGGASMIFAPEVEEMYPGGPSSTFVEVPGLSGLLEGASRPGHFRGVATIVLKLFSIVRPDLAFFGSKDYQQLQVIRSMVADLDLPVDIRAVPTVREADGLAMSSRNRYLGPEERRAAVVLFEALEAAKQAILGGERDAERVRQISDDR